MANENQESLPYQKGSAASRQAAEAFAPFAKGARYRVFRYIVEHPRCSDKEIQTALRMNPKTQSPRRIELEAKDLVRPAGTNERSAVVYVATGKAFPQDPPKGFWRSYMRKSRSHRPTHEEIRVAVETMRAAWRQDPHFPPEAVKVLRWLAEQAADTSEG